MSTYPIGTEAELELILENHHIAVMGVVRTLHANVGNGFEFTSISERSCAELAQVLVELEAREKLAAGADEAALSVPAYIDALRQDLAGKINPHPRRVLARVGRCARQV
jgi:hypothetical protein